MVSAQRNEQSSSLTHNRAAELGPTQFEWWLDWRGKAVAIVASGPSAKTANVSALRGQLPVIAIKECAIDLCPWADVAYGCDGAWWKHRRGLPDFKGLKLVWEPDVPALFFDVKAIEIKESPKPYVLENKYVDRILTNEPGVIGSGRNSGFQAVNLAVQFGADRILLIGFDMHDRNGAHYYGRNNWFKGSNPDRYQFERSLKAFNANASVLQELGVDVVNASMQSELKCFRKSTIEQTLAEWL